MSPEFYTIIGVAIGLAGLILNGQRSLADLRREISDLRKEVGDLRSAMHREFAAVRKEISALTGRVARLEGILEGPREAAVGDGA